MAKSIRSKWKRKMRAVKRERYGQKELERLKKVVANDEVQKNIKVLMEEISDITTKPNKHEGFVKNQITEVETKEEEMDDDSTKQVYSKNKNLRSQYGSYPVWMNQRKINKNKRARKGRPKRK